MSSLWIRAGLVAGGATLAAGAATAAFAATSGPARPPGPAVTSAGVPAVRTTTTPKSGCVIRVSGVKAGHVAAAKKKAAVERKLRVDPGKPGAPTKSSQPGTPAKPGKPADFGHGKKGRCQGTPVLLKGTVTAVQVAPGGLEETVRLDTGHATSGVRVLRKTLLFAHGRPVSPGTLPALTTGRHVTVKGLVPGGGTKTPLALVIVE